MRCAEQRRDSEWKEASAHAHNNIIIGAAQTQGGVKGEPGGGAEERYATDAPLFLCTQFLRCLLSLSHDSFLDSGGRHEKMAAPPHTKKGVPILCVFSVRVKEVDVDYRESYTPTHTFALPKFLLLLNYQTFLAHTPRVGGYLSCEARL